MSLFEELQEKLEDKLDYIKESNIKECNAKPVEPGETVVGNVADNQEIRALYALCLDMNDEIMDLEEEHDAVCPPEPEDQNYHDSTLFRLNQAKGKYNIAKEAMWLAVKRKFKKELVDKNHLGLRQDWQVVYVNNPPDNLLAAIGGTSAPASLFGFSPLAQYLLSRNLNRRNLD